MGSGMLKRIWEVIRKTFTLKVCGFLLALLVVSGVTVYTLTNVWQTHWDNLEADLNEYQSVIVKNSTELLTSQLVKIVIPGRELAKSRIFRTSIEGLRSTNQNRVDAAQEDLENFVRVSGFFAGHLFDVKGQLVATTEGRFEGDVGEYQAPIKKTMETRIPFFSPLYSMSGQLVSDLFVPVFPAKALSNAVDPVYVLVLSVPMTEILRSFLATEQSLEYSSKIHLIQQTDKGFQETVFRYPDNLELQEVGASFDGITGVEFGVRSDLYRNKDVFSSAIHISAIDWWVMIETDVSVLEASLEEYKNVSIWIASFALSTLVLLVLTVNFIISSRRYSRKSQVLESELMPLREEMALLTTLCDTLPYPVCLKERETGAYHYVNKAFSDFTGFAQREARGIVDGQVFTYNDSEALLHGDQMVGISGKAYAHELSITRGMDQRLVQAIVIPGTLKEPKDSILTIIRDITEEKQGVLQSIEMRQQIISALIRAVENVPFLDGQTALMRQLTMEIAETMLLSDSDCATVEAASILSQVGKAFIPKQILQKDGKLTPEEVLETKKYVEHTCRILEGIEFDLPITQTIWQMQETLDGAGYPNGLQGREISQLARILGVVNTFSALVKHRPHRRAKTAEEAVEILQSMADEKLDATVIDSLNAVIRTPKGRRILRGNNVEFQGIAA